MAVTDADLVANRRTTQLCNKTEAFLMILSIFFGLSCFILCLFAEATQSKVTWDGKNHKGKGQRIECVYSNSAKVPLFFAVGAFAVVAMAVLVEHIYLLVVVSKSTPPDLLSWEPDYANTKIIAWLIGAFFVTIWTGFTVGEVLLLVGIFVEWGHLSKWATPKSSCLVIRKGLFSAAGAIGLITVLLAGFCLTALRAQILSKEQDNVWRQVLDTFILHSSPPRLQLANENPKDKHSALV